MTQPRPVLLVASREVRERLRSRVFVWATLGLALVGVLAAAAPTVVERFAPDDGAAAAEPLQVGLVGELPEASSVALALTLGTPPTLHDLGDEAAARRALDDGRIDLAVLDRGARLLVPGARGPFGATSPPGTAAALGVARALEAAGVDAAAAPGILGAPPAEVEVVLSGTGVDPETAGPRFAIAYGGALFLYFTLVFLANLIVTGVIEEKASRVVEVLLPAVPARSLMAGKVLGLGIVGTIQAITIAAPGALVLVAVRGEALPPRAGSALVSVLVAFVLGYLLYAGITAGLSAMVSRVEDSQGALFPLYAILIASLLVTFPVLESPDSTLARVVTFVPFTAPFVVPVRIALVDLPLWQAGIAALGVVVAAVALTALAARLYEGSILRSGARVRFAAAWTGGRDT